MDDREPEDVEFSAALGWFAALSVSIAIRAIIASL
jgi:hypothetical protein